MKHMGMLIMLRILVLGPWLRPKVDEDPAQSAMNEYNNYYQQLDDIDFEPSKADSCEDINVLICADGFDHDMGEEDRVLDDDDRKGVEK